MDHETHPDSWVDLDINFNTLRPRQNGRHFPDDIFKCIFLNENVIISIKNSLKFVPKVPINNIPALVQIMAWRRPGDKPLSEAMMVSLLTHICVTRPQWVKDLFFKSNESRQIWTRLRDKAKGLDDACKIPRPRVDTPHLYSFRCPFSTSWFWTVHKGHIYHM